MEMALLYGTCDADAVKNLLCQFDEETRVTGEAILPEGIPEVLVEERDTSHFDRLLAGGAR